MNLRNKAPLIIMIILIIIGAIAMQSSLFTDVDTGTKDDIYDNDERIAGEADTWSIDADEQKLGSNSYSGKLKFSGCGTIWRYESSEDTVLEASCSLSVENQKAKVVLIAPDHSVTTLMESTKDTSTKELKTMTIPIKKGLNRIKLVGYKKTKVNAVLQIKEGKFEKIGFQ